MVKTKQQLELAAFLQQSGFSVEELGNQVFRVQREQELPVFLKLDERQIYFEVDLGNVQGIITTNLLLELLELNTEILPVSVGYDTSNPQDPHLVLVESRETGDLCENEVLAVFDALELAVDRVSDILANYINSDKQ